MDYPRCATCKHFSLYAAASGEGNCTLHTGLHRRDMFDLDPDYATDWGGETIGIDVDVNVNFGCVLHEAKE